MWKRITFIDRNGVGYSITRINDHTSGSTGGVKGKDSLDRYVELWDTECLKEDGAHLLSALFWVSWSFGQHSSSIFRIDSKFVVKAVMPDLFHVVPVIDDTMFD